MVAVVDFSSVKLIIMVITFYLNPHNLVTGNLLELQRKFKL